VQTHVPPATPPDEYNAVHVAAPANIAKLAAVANRSRTVRAHGTAVGLPSDADMGNSEVSALLCFARLHWERQRC